MIDKTAAYLFLAAVSVGLIVGHVLIDGIAVMLLWNWFVPLAAPGAPAISLPVAIGVSAVVSQLCPTPTGEHDTAASLKIIFLKPLVMVSFGWLAIQFA